MIGVTALDSYPSLRVFLLQERRRLALVAIVEVAVERQIAIEPHVLFAERDCGPNVVRPCRAAAWGSRA